MSELKRQGHFVYIEKDVFLRFDGNMRSKSLLHKGINKMLRLINQTEIKYWKGKIVNNPAYSEKYDLFLCINGVSFHPYLLYHLKSVNPLIKSSLYVWDPASYYDFFRYKECFDKVYTFDLADHVRYGVGYLPSYWFKTPERPIKYQLSMIGSDHDDRLEVVSKLYRQIKELGLTSLLKVVTRKHDVTVPYMTNHIFTLDEVARIIDESECVLDIDKPIQTGITQRVIWALARGKKVMTTNGSIKEHPFYNPNQIRIIDRDKPMVDVAFLTNEKEFVNSLFIENLRIDRWIEQLIY